MMGRGGHACPRPEPLKRVKARTLRQHAAARKACVDAVWRRENSRCWNCRREVMRPRETDNSFNVGHVHEIVYRSLGGSDTYPSNAVLLCPVCHRKVHEKLVRLSA